MAALYPVDGIAPTAPKVKIGGNSSVRRCGLDPPALMFKTVARHFIKLQNMQHETRFNLMHLIDYWKQLKNRNLLTGKNTVGMV
jgi:hypothetical protein